MVRKDQEAARVEALYMPFCCLINASEYHNTHSVAKITQAICLYRSGIRVTQGY
jgi:hypothetical protein